MLKFFKKHKVISSLLILGIIGGGYYAYVKITAGKAETRYVLEAVEKGSIITTISGSGQISSSNQVEIKPKVSGDVIKVAVKEAQEVKTGDLLIQLDTKDAQKTLRDAQTSLQSAKLSLQKTMQTTDAASLLSAQNSLESAKTNLTKLKLSQTTDYQKAEETKQAAQDDLVKAYDDAYTVIANTFLNLPTIITKLNDVLFSEEIGKSEKSLVSGQWNTNVLIDNSYADDKFKVELVVNKAEADYQTARSNYDKAFLDYKNSNRSAQAAEIEGLLSETLAATKAMAQAAKSSSNMLDAWSDARSLRSEPIFSQVTSYKTSLGTYIGQINSSISSLLSQQNVIKNSKDTIASADRDLLKMNQNNPLDLAAAEQSVKQQEASLAKLQAGADVLDVRTQELSVAQKQNAVTDAYQQLSEYAVKAPFDGKIAVVSVVKGDSTSSGTSVVTLIAPQMVAELSLNEVDAAKVAVGQKATLTFDALSDLDITGKVAQVDTVGTVSQGVVTYTVKIALDTNDEKIKIGMSVNANIITEAKQDIIIVPSAAIKTSGEESYVEMPNETVDASLISSSGQSGLSLSSLPKRQTVQVGITDNTYTEITSGLAEGDYIITSTVVTTVASKSATKSLISFGPGNSRNNSSSTSKTGSSATRTTSGSSGGGEGGPPGM